MGTTALFLGTLLTTVISAFLAPNRLLIPAGRQRSGVFGGLQRVDTSARCSPLRLSKNGEETSSPDNTPFFAVTDDRNGDKPSAWYNSHISVIRSRNLAGIVSDDEDKDITIYLGDGPSLIAVTGETGSGKSLLIAKVAEICTGGKATSSYVPMTSAQQTAEDDDRSHLVEVEMVIRLSEPHLSWMKQKFEALGLDQSLLFTHEPQTDNSMGTLVLKRTLSIGNTRTARLKSFCRVNGQPVTLKVLRSIAAPLLAIVDAAAAASALAKPNARMAIIDTAVPVAILSDVRAAMLEYRQCRSRRERLEQELASRVLPPSFSDTQDDDKDFELLQHWVDELDAFEKRMTRFSESVGEPSQANKQDPFVDAVHSFTASAWSDNSSPPEDSMSFSSLLYANLVEFREAVKSLDAQVGAAHTACEALGALSLETSAKTALERARNSLFDAAGATESGPLFVASEKSHELLNAAERALEECVQSIEDDRKGLINVLEGMRSSVNLSLEDIDDIIADWNTLARKHGISPYVLPSCHMALRGELDGNVEARSLLPGALQKERSALVEFEEACQVLSQARQEVAANLSASVTGRMSSLGFGASSFDVLLKPNAGKCTDRSVYGGGSSLGIDSVDFMLRHGEADSTAPSDRVSREVESDATTVRSPQSHRGGKLDVVASSGEKARILLAIETELPGSIGASCSATDRVLFEASSEGEVSYPPVAVIYDEIDAHVGGRAAVSLANMLADQSRERLGPSVGSKARGQVVSITHSPSVAAVADLHLVIQKQSRAPSGLEGVAEDRTVPVRASGVDGPARRKELARMASGDLAVDEAEVFAEALIRDGAKRRNAGDP